MRRQYNTTADDILYTTADDILYTTADDILYTTAYDILDPPSSLSSAVLLKLLLSQFRLSSMEGISLNCESNSRGSPLSSPLNGWVGAEASSVSLSSSELLESPGKYDTRSDVMVVTGSLTAE